MKILYFGTICDKENYMRIRENFREKPSIAPFVFETALLKGFQQNSVDLETISFPVIPAFPKSKYLAWGKREEILESGYKNTWIPAINISGVKQLCQRYHSGQILEEWLRRNAMEEKAVIIYSAYYPIAKSIVALCKKYHTKCYAIIPDLPRDMYSIANIGLVKKNLSRLYVQAAEKVQGKFDGYIYLTDAMKNVINPTAPYIVVEGIANVSEVRELSIQNKEPGFVVMYAGALNEKLGLRNLIEAFMRLQNDDARLWIFGAGDFQEKVEEYGKKDTRICFFGSVDRKNVLEYERKATLLVNVREDKSEFTKYSFPSKTIEYMLSGTPLLTTRLIGIPQEYYRYSFSVSSNTPTVLMEKLKEIAEKSAEELLEIGRRAQRFIQEEKNGQKQAKKIEEFVLDQIQRD